MFPMSDDSKSCKSCAVSGCPSAGSEGSCGGESPEAVQQQLQQMMAAAALKKALGRIRYKLLVFSGKGGVGKSTVSVNLAADLAKRGFKVGLLDVDFHGPSVPQLAGVIGMTPPFEDGRITPVPAPAGFAVVSIGLLVEDPDEAVVWRGPAKMAVIQQLLRDVEWGDLDFLLIDSPPGTGDEPLSVVQIIHDITGAALVTTPQQVAIADVRRSANFCDKVNVSVVGVVENMAGFACPKCGEITPVFSAGGAAKMCQDLDLPLLGSIPLDIQVMRASEEGRPFVLQGGVAAASFSAAVDQLLRNLGETQA
jgi:Mrp family chromosome partitioning ATPase